MLKLTRSRMLDAMRRNDASFDGLFFVGVLSTGIYCLPSCPARTPLPKNVAFYATAGAARKAGLRPCRRCRPDRFPDVRPPWLDRVVRHLADHRAERLCESALARLAGVDISTVRRAFRRHYGVTPLAYHRRLRLERARRLIEAGAGYLGVAYECGWESASGFREAFAREFGVPPGKVRERR